MLVVSRRRQTPGRFHSSRTPVLSPVCARACCTPVSRMHASWTHSHLRWRTFCCLEKTLTLPSSSDLPEGSSGCFFGSTGVNPKGAGRKGALLLDVYGDLTPKEKCTCRVRAHGGGWRDAACAEVASRAGATVDGHYSSYNFEQWVNGDGG